MEWTKLLVPQMSARMGGKLKMTEDDKGLPAQYYLPWKLSDLSTTRRAMIHDSLGRVMFYTTDDAQDDAITLAKYVIDLVNAKNGVTFCTGCGTERAEIAAQTAAEEARLEYKRRYGHAQSLKTEPDRPAMEPPTGTIDAALTGLGDGPGPSVPDYARYEFMGTPFGSSVAQIMQGDSLPDPDCPTRPVIKDPDCKHSWADIFGGGFGGQKPTYGHTKCLLCGLTKHDPARRHSQAISMCDHDWKYVRFVIDPNTTPQQALDERICKLCGISSGEVRKNNEHT
jgi:hypothetical protein